jgi:hypothetical protein
MGTFSGRFEYEEIVGKESHGRQMVRIMEPMSYHCTDGIANGVTVEINKGFVTDLASIPQIFFLLKPADKDWARPAVFHDKACQMARSDKSDLTMRQADAILFYAMKDHGKAWIGTCWLFWSFVRVHHMLKGEM